MLLFHATRVIAFKEYAVDVARTAEVPPDEPEDIQVQIALPSVVVMPTVVEKEGIELPVVPAVVNCWIVVPVES